MSTKIVSKNSSGVVLKHKTGYFTGMDGMGAVGLPLISNVLSFFTVAVPVSNVPGWDIPSSILMGILAGTALPALGGKYWNAYQVNENLKEYTGTKMTTTPRKSVAKTFFNSLVPFGQTVKTGSEVVLSDQAPQHLIGGSSSINRYYSHYDNKAESYKADTYVKFTLFGTEIRQVITPTPITVWDEAFKSSLAVHEFEPEKVLTSSKKR